MKNWIPCRLFFSLAFVMVFYAGTPQAWAAPAATTTTLTITSGGNAVASGGSVAAGSVVTLTASVSSGSTQLTIGQVNFCDALAKYCTDIHLLGTAQLTSAGTAVFRFRPGFGSHSYKAVFAGTPNGVTAYAGSTSSTTTLTVTATFPTITAIAASGSAGNYSLTATVTGSGSAVSPVGTVSFLDASNGNLSLGTANLGASTPGLSFLNASNPENGQEVGSFAVGDFNGDGILDLAVGNNVGNTVIMLFGNGDGTFTPGPSTPVTGPIAAAGDFNGDGFLDLAVATDTWTVLLGDGTGNFTAKTSGVAGYLHNYTGIAAADMNGDGILDLVEASPDNPNFPIFFSGLTTMFGNGDGTFTNVASSSKYAQTGSYPGGIAVGDFNRDGILDLAVTDEQGGGVEVLLGDGHGNYAQSAYLATGTFPVRVAAGDFNGDGTLDLAVVNDGSNTVTILLGNGDGTFKATAASPQTGINPGSIAVGDFNGDGIPDLAVLNTALPNSSQTVTILLGNGDGTFTPAARSPQAGISATVVSADDFNGDGISDLAVLNANTFSMTVLLAQLTQTATAMATGIAPLGTGTHQVEASYPANSSYSESTSAFTGLTAQQGTPTVKVTPSSASVTTAQQLTVTINVTSATGNPTPTGAVTLTGGGYTSAATALTGGTATINVPAGSLALGADTLTASYPGDANYVAAGGTAQVTVTNPTFAISGTAVTVTAGATTGNISTITVTPSGGFTGSVALAAAVTSSPAGAVNPPTFSFSSTTPVSITGAAAGTASLTISTTQALGCSATSSTRHEVPWYAGGGAALACILLFGIPARRRSWRTMLGMLTLLAALTTGVMACGGGNGSGTCTAVRPATTSGTYSVTVTGTSGALTETGNVTLTVQ